MIQSTTLIADIKEDFEGGSSLSVDWDTLIRRAVENVLDNIRPETLKRIKPVYGAVAQNIYRYYAPTDVLVPAFFFPNDGLPLENPLRRNKFEYTPPSEFYRQLKDSKFTLEYINGARFLTVNHAKQQSRLTIDAMSEVGTKTGGSPVLNEQNYIEGSASVEATFTDAGVEFGDTITAIDITDYYLKGVVTLPTYIPTADNISTIEIRLKTTDSDYYSVITSVDNIEDFLIDGWNLIQFEMANKTTTGSPTITNIVEWSVIGTTTSGKTETLIFDKLAIQKFAPHYLEYYSDRPYVTSAGVLWQNTITNANSDKINFNRDVAGILHYELAILVEHSSKFTAKDDFRDQLKRKYRAYWENHPSAQTPISYSKSPEIDISQDIDSGRVQDDTVSTS